MQESLEAMPFWKVVLVNIPLDAGAIIAYVICGGFFFWMWSNRST